MVDPGGAGYPPDWNAPPPPSPAWSPGPPGYPAPPAYPAQLDPYGRSWIPVGQAAPGGPAPGWPIPGPPPRPPAITAWIAIVIITGLGMVAAAVSPFLTLWTFKTRGETTMNFTGWATTTGGDESDNTGHDTRYGVVLVVGAAILLAALIVLLVRRSAVVGALLAGIGGMFLAGVAAEAVVDYSSRLSYNSGTDVQWGAGPSLTLMVATGALGTAGAILATVAAVRASSR